VEEASVWPPQGKTWPATFLISIVSAQRRTRGSASLAHEQEWTGREREDETRRPWRAGSQAERLGPIGGFLSGQSEDFNDLLLIRNGAERKIYNEISI
jgi:hypothetical protein